MREKGKLEAIDEVKDLLNSLKETKPKKYKNLNSWLKNYVEYLKFEDKFEPQKLCRYRKGEILKVNLGFNVGSEEGGVHYCMVLDKQSKNSPVITVIPLTSIKEDKDLSKLHKGEVNLGNELFEKLNSKIDKNIMELERALEVSTKRVKKFEEILKETAKKFEEILPILTSKEYKRKKIHKLIKGDKRCKRYKIYRIEKNYKLKKQIDIIKSDYIVKIARDESKKLKKQNKIFAKNNETIKSQLEFNEKLKKEVSKMKIGSIALINQITTVSKMRIIDPKKDTGVLSGIKLSNEKLDLIDKEIKNMYVK